MQKMSISVFVQQSINKVFFSQCLTAKLWLHLHSVTHKVVPEMTCNVSSGMLIPAVRILVWLMLVPVSSIIQFFSQVINLRKMCEYSHSMGFCTVCDRNFIVFF